ncbi:hypothetical protein Pelo_2731 [Pelomyxa schiedti]|nr:hypothetical protein Pelo_2731 [Pelomyxa schiedti]
MHFQKSSRPASSDPVTNYRLIICAGNNSSKICEKAQQKAKARKKSLDGKKPYSSDLEVCTYRREHHI